MTCPVCCHEMQTVVNRMTWDCDNCGFTVSEMDACQLGAKTAQEAANLKMAELIYEGWSPYAP